MKEAVEKAKVLLESLPYMREFSGQTVVIKYGGSAMTEENLKQSFALNVVLLKYIGINPVIVHGGGPQIGKMLTQLGIDSTFKQGLRVTDPATMDVVEMVLAGRVNKEIVNLINQSGGLAVGLSGKDGKLIEADKMEMVLSREDAPPEIIDLGRVGEVQRIETALLDSLQQRGFIPIIAPVGVDGEGATYNINADDVTASVAEALGAKRMILLTDVEGVTSGGSLLSSLSRFDAVRGIEQGHIQGGMIPKVKCCLEALEAGVDKTHIIDGRVENSILLEMFTNAGIGTEIVP